jgi:hypothetical protein
MLTSIPIFKIFYPGVLAPVAGVYSTRHHRVAGAGRERNSLRIIALGEHPYQLRAASASPSSFVLTSPNDGSTQGVASDWSDQERFGSKD